MLLQRYNSLLGKYVTPLPWIKFKNYWLQHDTSKLLETLSCSLDLVLHSVTFLVYLRIVTQNKIYTRILCTSLCQIFMWKSFHGLLHSRTFWEGKQTSSIATDAIDPKPFQYIVYQTDFTAVNIIFCVIIYAYVGNRKHKTPKINKITIWHIGAWSTLNHNQEIRFLKDT